MNKNTQHKLTLITGGTGKTGGRVAAQLKQRGMPVRIGSRSGEPPFDWEDQATWAPALQDVDMVYLLYYPDLALPGGKEAIRTLSEMAIAAGVQRIVLLAGRGEPEAEACEEVVKNSGIAEWTIVRPTWFAHNFSESFLLEPVQLGEVALPAGDVREPFVHVDDIADVVVAALTEDRHMGRTYELTGPRALTFPEAVAEIAEATGRQIRYVQVPLEAYLAAVREQQVPDDIVVLLRLLFTDILDGRNSHPTDGVRRALGREPRDFAQYAREAAATGVWEATS